MGFNQLLQAVQLFLMGLQNRKNTTGYDFGKLTQRISWSILRSCKQVESMVCNYVARTECKPFGLVGCQNGRKVLNQKQISWQNYHVCHGANDAEKVVNIHNMGHQKCTCSMEWKGVRKLHFVMASSSFVFRSVSFFQNQAAPYCPLSLSSWLSCWDSANSVDTLWRSPIRICRLASSFWQA